VTSIEKGTFELCRSLTSVTIPASVTSIEIRAFANCPALRSITVQNPTPPELEEYVFYDIRRTATIYVPKGSIEAYRIADGWDSFYNIAPIEIAVDETTANKKSGARPAMVILSALLLSAAVFVIVKKSRINQEAAGK
jgi:hypothetical protein